jgi:hypothetical protein
MATYNEIHNAVNGATFAELRNRIWVATLVKAKAVIADAAAPEPRLNWAKSAFSDIDRETELMLLNLIGGSTAQTIAVLAAVNDAAVQTAVNTAIDALYPAA